MVGPKTSPGAASRAEPAPILWLSGGLFHSLFHLRLAPWSAGCGTCQKFQSNVIFRVWECFLLPDGARSRTPLPSLPSLQPAASAINLFFQKVTTLWEGQSVPHLSQNSQHPWRERMPRILQVVELQCSSSTQNLLQKHMTLTC